MLNSPLQPILERIKNIRLPYPLKLRQPAAGAKALALTGAILIHTPDQNNIVITPSLARDLAKALPQLADQAEEST